MPKRTRYRKPHRGDINHQTASRGTEVSFGEFGLQTVEAAWIDNRQIEAARRAITREIRRGGKVWIRIFPDKAITAKPAETRMGKGKGAPERWVAPVRPGRVMFELAGVRREVAMEALRKAGHKLPVRTKIVEREGAPTETEQ
jgi:large subunit ribosomal protein L16